VVLGARSLVVPHGLAPPIADVLGDLLGIADHPGQTLYQLLGCVIVLDVLGLDLLIHENRTTPEPWIGGAGDDADS
jgi:hypothetical protein